MMCLHRINAERTADVAGCKHPSSGFDHSVEIHPGKLDAFMVDTRNPVTSFEELGQEPFACDRIVGQVMVRLFVMLKRDGVFDFIFCEHGLVAS